MLTFSRDEVIRQLVGIACDTELEDMVTDNKGQLIIKTEIYAWSDGTYHDEPEIDPDAPRH